MQNAPRLFILSAKPTLLLFILGADLTKTPSVKTYGFATRYGGGPLFTYGDISPPMWGVTLIEGGKALCASARRTTYFFITSVISPIYIRW